MNLKGPLQPPSKPSLFFLMKSQCEFFKPEELLIGNNGSFMNLPKKATAEIIDKCSFSLCLEICPQKSYIKK